MHKLAIIIFLLLPTSLSAHPGIGIVSDSKGNIYYTDLEQVWKISHGKKTIAIRNVHTHELYIDSKDNLYGENEQYDHRTQKFYHSLWMLSADGKLDTLVKNREAYQEFNFSLARDVHGNEYYTKEHVAGRDTIHIYKRPPGGNEQIMATGNFKGIAWLHPQDDGSVLYVKNNTVYRVNANGDVSPLATNLASSYPAVPFKATGLTVWGVWQDKNMNVYVAVFSDQVIKKISADGKVTDHYRSAGNWTPLFGVFDKNGQLWIMEGSDKNAVRVVMVDGLKAVIENTDHDKKRSDELYPVFIGAGVAVVVYVGMVFYRRRRKHEL